MVSQSERKQAEEALLKAGALQNAIFNSANFSSIATDAKGVIQIFNVGAERMLGYTAAEVVDKITPAEISDPQEVIARAEALSLELGTTITPGFEALVFKASRGIEDIYELTYIRKDGSRFPAIVSVTALRDAQDTIIGYLLIGTDNTARKQAEEALLKAGALQNAIFNSANFSSIATDAKGVIQIFNVGAERMLGYTAAEVVDKITPAEISDPQEVIARAEALSLKLETTITPGFEALVFKASRGIEDIYELTYIRKDGSRFPAIVSVTALRDAQDTIIGYLLIGTDNTARKQAEEALLKAGALQNAIFNSANFSSIATDAKGVIQIFNVGAERMLGYTAAEVVDKITPAEISDPQEVIARAEALSLELETTITPGFEALVFKASRGIEDIYELTYIRKDGSRFPAIVSVTALRDAQDTIIGYLLIGTDNTARRLVEEKLRWTEESFRLMVGSVTDYAIVMLDPEGRVVSWNAGAERIEGYSAEEIVGQHFSRFYPHEDIQSGKPQRDLDVVAAKGQFEDEGRRVRQDGSTFWANVVFTPIRDQGGNLRGFAMLTRDLTEPMIIEETLTKAKDTADAANQAKSAFLATMSHELRTPMNAILGYSEILMEEAKDKGQEDFIPDLEKIHASGNHLLDLINNILDLSKIEAGKMDLFLESFGISRVIEDVVSTVRPLVEKNANTLRVHCAADLGTMHADLAKVRQSLFNLLSNACKFTENGTITLEVSRELIGGVDWIKFIVSDTGIGMAPDQMEKLFQPFIQGDASTSRKFGGTGLGMTITRRFCQMMGGEISASSEPGGGTTFSIRLPAQVKVHPPAAAPLSEPPEQMVSEGLSTVLVIEDDANTRDLLKRFLNKDGFRVQTVSEGEEGLRLARELQPDVITLDVMMPGLDGWAVLTELKADPALAEIPVVMLTIVDNKNLGYALGASDYLTKPIQRERLLAVLEKYRRHPQPGPVLVVEDDPETREILRRLLEKEGCQVIAVENGRVALERLAESQPMLILLDLMMPEMDGFQFVDRMRQHENWRTIPIVVVTAKDLTKEDRLRLNGYVQEIIRKDACPRDELLAEVSELVKSCLEKSKLKTGNRPPKKEIA
jgi:PAS domain S-box-containing protein